MFNMYPDAIIGSEQNVKRTMRTMNILRVSKNYRLVHYGRKMSELFLLIALES